MLSRIKTTVSIILAFLPGLAFSADVVFFYDSKVPSPALPTLEMSSQFYGLQLMKYSVSLETEQSAISAFVSENRPLAVIISARSITRSPLIKFLGVLKRGDGSPMPVLVLDVDPERDGPLLKELSEGRISNAGRAPGNSQLGRYQIGDIERVAGHLNRRTFAIKVQTADLLAVDPTDGIQDIIALTLASGESAKSVFTMVPRNGQEWFFLTRFQVTCPLYDQRPTIDKGRILEALPILMFLRYACGERCWAGPGHYANLTIDDPWLREPYGHLRFAPLLAEMEKANFHTTLAFIPWNYNRSQPAVISLFREHPDRFSICVHGNDHDRSEFVDPNSARHREADIVQGLARMEAFTRLTGISFDAVMVFPHTIASDVETLAVLKKYNFLATMNQDNIPLSSPRPKDLLFYLRSVTLDYANFPSVNRAGIANQSESDIALELFLGNPLLFYDHHDLFRRGIDRFNRWAETINTLEPSTRWTSLGTVSRHLYLTRIREDGDCDVLAFSRCIELENPRSREMNFYFHKPESFQFPIRRFAVDGKAVPYEKTAAGIDLILKIPPGAKRLIELEYENDFVGSSVDIAKTSTRSRILRKLSDFRDIRLSSFPLGRAVVDLFYSSGAYRWTRGKLALFGLAALAVLAVLILYVFRCVRRIRARRRADPSAGSPSGRPDQ